MRAKTALRDFLIGGIAPIADAAYRERPRVRVLAFHDTPPDQERLLRERLRWLGERSAIVPLTDAFARDRLDQERLNVVLTFDDGLKQHHEVAAPVLQDLGYAGTFFVPTGALDLVGEAAAEFSRTGLRRSTTFEFMGTGDVRELAGQPSFDIGGHTHSHRDLGGSPELAAELGDSKKLLEQATGAPVRWFAYPFGSPTHLSLGAVDAIRAAGFEAAFTIVPAFWSREHDLFLLGRDSLALEDSTASWERFLRGGYDTLSRIKYRRPLAAARRHSAERTSTAV